MGSVLCVFVEKQKELKPLEEPVFGLTRVTPCQGLNLVTPTKMADSQGTPVRSIFTPSCNHSQMTTGGVLSILRRAFPRAATCEDRSFTSSLCPRVGELRTVVDL